MQFHDKLQKLRKEKGLSQEALAEMMGVSRQAISKWESGQTYPETDKLIVLSDIYGVTLDSLLKDTETQTDYGNTVSAPYWVRRGSYYEYKSKRILFGLPLIHVNVGYGVRKAKGIIAIGNAAQGFLAIGLAAMGLLSIGVASLGLLGIGVVSLGLLMSIGSISMGAFAIGAVAVGIVTLGAVSVGVYSLGALAVGARVAVGDYAVGHIAVGRRVDGAIEFLDTSVNKNFSAVSAEQVRLAIRTEFPNTWRWVVNMLTWFMG